MSGFAFLLCAGSLFAAAPPAPSTPQAKAAMAGLPLRFEENRGQWDPSVRFTARSNGVNLQLTDARTGVPGRLKPRRNRPGPRQRVARHPAARKAAGRHQLSGGRAQPVAYRRRQLRPRALPERLSRHRRGLLRQPESAGIRFRSRSRRQPRRHPPQLPRRRKGQPHARRRSRARCQRRADPPEGARDLPGQAARSRAGTPCWPATRSASGSTATTAPARW